MFDSLFDGSALNCLYGAALLIGFLYALFLLFFQGVGHAFDLGDFGLDGHDIDLGGHDFDVDHSGHEASGLSMLAISGFVTAFGAFGLVSTSLLGAGDFISLLVATVGGLVVGGAGQLFFIHILSPTVSSNLMLDDLKGTEAQVTVPIPAEGMGQVACIVGGQRITLSARSSSQIDIGQSVVVIVDSMLDGVAYVSIAIEP